MKLFIAMSPIFFVLKVLLIGIDLLVSFMKMTFDTSSILLLLLLLMTTYLLVR